MNSSRRDVLRSAAAIGLIGFVSRTWAETQEQIVRVGIDMSLTGSDAQAAAKSRDGALLAFEEANAANAIPGVRIEVVTLDDGTATAGQYDPAQAAINARKMVSDKRVVAAIGPQMSGAGKAMSPILSMGGLATITPSSTSPDITDPAFAAQYRPAGKAVYFRTVTTDAYQGPNMANFYVETLKAKRIYVLDDGGAYGVGMADAFEAQARNKGAEVVGRDRLDPKAADYSAVLTRIKSLGVDALYFGGVSQAGVKLMKQAHDIVPDIIKGGGDGIYAPDILTGGGFPAVEGWYVTIASPHALDGSSAQDFVARYTARFGMTPDDPAITSYDGALVIIDALKRVSAGGKTVTREAVRDAIQAARVPTLQGVVSFDENGDLADRTISVFQIRQDGKYPLDDVLHQYRFLGTAPQS